MKIIVGILLMFFAQLCFGQDDLYKKSQDAMMKGDMNLSLKTLNDLLAKYPNYTSAYFSRSMIYNNQQNPTMALRDYDQMIRIEPANQDFLKMRATLKMNLGDIKGALADLTKRIELNPNNAMHYYDRGHARGSVETADLAACVKDYDRAIQLKPDLREAYALRGFAKIYIFTRTRKSNTIPANLVADPCSDLRKAKSMGDNSVDNMMRAYCN